MTDKETKVILVDMPDPGKLEEHGISIDAPTPTQIVMPDPWAPTSNGPDPQLSPPDGPQSSDQAADK